MLLLLLQVFQSSKKRKEKGKASPTKAKRQCVSSGPEKEVTTFSNASSSAASFSSPKETAAKTAIRLQSFQFVENSDKDDVPKKALWEPKDLPDIFSKSDGATDADVIALSGESDGDDDQQQTQKNNKRNKNTAKKEGETSTTPSSVNVLRSKFSTGSSAKKSQLKYTPLEQQYVTIKEHYPDVVLLVECGYKYRFFGQDAEVFPLLVLHF